MEIFDNAVDIIAGAKGKLVVDRSDVVDPFASQAPYKDQPNDIFRDHPRGLSDRSDL